MKCEGVVTEVEDFFCYTVVDNVKKIHWSILLAENSLTKLPEVGAKVSLKNVHQHEQTFVVCTESLMEGTFNKTIKSNSFLAFVRLNNLGIADLIKVDEIIKICETSFNNISLELRNNIILSIIRKLITLSSFLEVENHQCLNKQIAYFNIISLNSCKSVEINSDKYLKFPTWSFGIHSHVKTNTLLLGYLKIHQTYGLLFLRDSQYGLPCVVISNNSNNEHLISFVNSYVMIKDYKIITEVFKENVPNIEYLLIELKNVFVIYSEGCNSILTTDKLPSIFFSNISFVLKKKSMISVSIDNKPQCYLEISITQKNNVSLCQLENIFLIVNSKCLEQTAFLNENHMYILHFNNPLKLIQNWELSRIAPYKIYELTDINSVFQKLGDTNCSEQLLTIEECKKNLFKNTALMSFQGILKSKKLTTNRLGSRTSSRKTIYGFGTPGSQVHQLVFSYKENDKEIFLDCYLNNWENILMPLGLIPQMRIAVKNVLPQSKKYLKSVAFTTFEILSYEPQIDFHTVNLYENDDIDWGPRFFLGHGTKIPFGVIIWGRVYDIHILSLDISRVCNTCNKNTEINCSCSDCNETGQQIKFFMKLDVCDEYAQSKVFVNDIEFLKYVLDLPDNLFKTWKEAFEQIGIYNFNIFEPPPIISEPVNENDLFKNAFTEYLRNFNSSAIIQLDLKCRKLDSNSKNQRKPVWWYIDARKS